MSDVAAAHPAGPAPGARPPGKPILNRSDLVLLVGGAVVVALAGATRYANAAAVLAFLCSAVAVALLAALVGRSVEQLGDRFGAGATGVLQSALGNLPELFISFFALRAGLVTVVQSAIIGSILANLLLVLGAAFVVGGLRHGTQRFAKSRARDTCVLLALATAALVLPSLAKLTPTPAALHTRVLSDIVAVVLIIVFALSVPFTLRRGRRGGEATAVAHEPPRWPTWLAVALLAAAGVAAGLVSDWFVTALTPAMHALDLSQ